MTTTSVAVHRQRLAEGCALARRAVDLGRSGHLPMTGMQLRATDANTLVFEGYASVTETPYQIEDWLGTYSEVVRRGSFGKTLAEQADVPFKINHDGLTLARTKSGTMRLAEDDHGLHVEADLDPSSPHVQALRSAMERGDVDEMSFAFRVTRQEWSPNYDQRDILEVDLNKGDVSIVNYGANSATAGATLRGDNILRYLEWVSPEERRRVFELLAGQFTDTEPDAAEVEPTRVVPLSLNVARARQLAL